MAVKPRVTRDSLRAYFPDGRWTGRVQPLPDHNCVFVKNSKAGTSTVLLWLHRAHTGDHGWSPVRGIHRDHTLPRLSEVGMHRVVQMLAGEAVRFTFVRHPLRRVESAYRDKVLRHRSYRGRAELQRLLGLPEGPDQDLTFDQFVVALETQEPIRMDPHWRPQHLNLMHPLVEYDLVGRLETFDADLIRLRELTGIPDVPIDVQSATRKSGDSMFDGRLELRRRVEAIYARDFELYGY